MNTTATLTRTFEGKTAQEWLAEGQGCYKTARDSFERCDEDGFMTQKVNTQHAHMCELKAKLAENGARTEVDAIFDLDGNLIDATWASGQFGPYWYAPSTARGQRGTYYNESQAKSETTRRNNNAKKGFYIGRVRVAATVEFVSGGSGMAGAFSGAYQIVRVSQKLDLADTEIIDNGK